MAAAERASNAIPEAERTGADWINLGAALSDLGRFDEGISATSRATADEDAPWVKNNVIWMSLRKGTGGSYRDGAISRDVAARWLRELEDAQGWLAQKKPNGWQHVQSLCIGTQAEIQLTIGALDDAMLSLDRAAALSPPNARQRLCRARILAKRGERAKAREEVERALAGLHPEGDTVAEVRAFAEELGATPASPS
jgi:tetratricopeptide (TPR) repeat protein